MPKFTLTIESEDAHEFKDLIRPFVGAIAAPPVRQPESEVEEAGEAAPQQGQQRTRRTKAQIAADEAAARAASSSGSTESEKTEQATSTNADAKPVIEFQAAEAVELEITEQSLKAKLAKALADQKLGGVPVIGAKFKELAGTMSIGQMDKAKYPEVDAYLNSILP